MEPILQVRHLTTELRLQKKAVSVVSDLSFDLYPGRTLAIVGESGSGKSMTALSVMGILPEPPALPPKGEIWFQGKNILTCSPKEMRAIRGSKIAMIFQDPMMALNPVTTIGAQLLEVAEVHLNLFGEEAYAKAIAVLGEVGIPQPEERFFSYPHQLSGGMKQRVMIAMALMGEPKILIADEPTTALDVTIQAQVLQLMKDLQRRYGMALLLITHDMQVVRKMADEVLVMYATESVEVGSLAEVVNERAHPYTQGLLKAAPEMHQPKERLYVIQGAVPSPADLPTGCHFHPRCPFVMEKCKAKKIPYYEVGKGHHARCVLYE